MTAIMEFQNVARSYGPGPLVLKDVTFSMAPGEVVGLLGHNGAGKTTAIRLAMGMLFPHAGSVRVFGLAPTAEPVAVRRRIGYVAEDQILPPNLSVAELIAFHQVLFRSWDAALERQLLDRFGLPRKAKIKTLSKGQARQAALLCAVCHRPELLILDEPAGGLDPVARRGFIETAVQLLGREGTAILFSSHHMSDVERIGARVVLINGGTVFLDRELDRLREATTVAMIPRDAAPGIDAIRRLPGCLGARIVYDDWHAVIEGSPESVQPGVSGGVARLRACALHRRMEEGSAVIRLDARPDTV
jgi:ABC-2 type transport system ATP-binding protein